MRAIPKCLPEPWQFMNFNNLEMFKEAKRWKKLLLENLLKTCVIFKSIFVCFAQIYGEIRELLVMYEDS